jgi:hypothetical protein
MLGYSAALAWTWRWSTNAYSRMAGRAHVTSAVRQHCPRRVPCCSYSRMPDGHICSECLEETQTCTILLIHTHYIYIYLSIYICVGFRLPHQKHSSHQHSSVCRRRVTLGVTHHKTLRLGHEMYVHFTSTFSGMPKTRSTLSHTALKLRSSHEMQMHLHQRIFGLPKTRSTSRVNTCSKHMYRHITSSITWLCGCGPGSFNIVSQLKSKNL